MSNLESMHKALIKIKMESDCSLDIKAEWLANFVVKHYPNDKAKCKELVALGGHLAAQFDGMLHVRRDGKVSNNHFKN